VRLPPPNPLALSLLLPIRRRRSASLLPGATMPARASPPAPTPAPAPPAAAALSLPGQARVGAAGGGEEGPLTGRRSQHRLKRSARRRQPSTKFLLSLPLTELALICPGGTEEAADGLNETYSAAASPTSQYAASSPLHSNG
jgi:hypothetical protein